ncbi:hypothetical protein HBI56_081270 [Parastagonospora nodorum]|uniref:Uncharacterized protein n=1 Tax=Phaeosphaeria nodorum (strain SN15 / ATCC MYA-4574 / FGSC 10173) TaxID=321614 RepID=A0A7U2FGC2_PHANO|nr:hypothetical protein HBH56_105420 [Parastagonospora nodorum]QRD04755.1 hypothetical protein JI435_421630 [Parastagonospora nodorum SN15]KAH3929289.1 hypothetical protein HBH54_124990 [Parastagonospora nodorum]KAH3951741.1 hypothetical protein HBH53_058990 [Parastagonospora nodorum]KAH3975727.1 hypothetical protein HBH52_127870 [Parastagonospora nodorum]
MASNDEHFAIHLTACILGSHQFHLRFNEFICSSDPVQIPLMGPCSHHSLRHLCPTLYTFASANLCRLTA